MDKSLHVLITSIPARGHLNCAIAFGDLLKERGHSIFLAQREAFQNIAESHGFNFIPFDETIFGTEKAEPYGGWLRRNSHLFRNGWEGFRQFTREDCESYGEHLKYHPLIDKALAKVFRETSGIDVIVSDMVTKFPSLADCGIPSVNIISFNPLVLHPNGIPPYAGFSTKLKDPVLFEDYHRVKRNAWSNASDRVKNWYRSCGKDSWANEFDELDEMRFINHETELGFYHYADDLDYHEFGPTYPNWYRVDFCVRESKKKFNVPSKLQKLPGKLIFFSMGSVASMDHEIMKMLLKILSKSPHRFIVSTGACGDQLELYDNMWGEPYVDQIAILQTVDLVITHGGNNSLMETLYYARPMIVIPYFFDQLDNAVRVEEKQIGRQINIWDFDEEKLLNTIEDVLGDNQIKENVEKISENMKKSTSREEAAKRVEEFVKTKRQSKRKE
ncbi:UDP-glucuronosyltransferase 3A1-like [Brevipalpus obovatus]|uniref:UDP-glucuronosyltransferase 3A1-like n=1 Tax=Brevipalpus obovatus TaxID=246614 RepID=UPI003D9DCCC5